MGKTQYFHHSLLLVVVVEVVVYKVQQLQTPLQDLV
jgi:hypothetical protein